MVISFARAQEPAVRKEKPYVYDITYTETLSRDSLKGEYIMEDIYLKLYLGVKAINETSKIIVTLDNLKEAGDLTGRSVHYNFTDRLLGWDAAIEKRLKSASDQEKIDLASKAKSKDKVKIDIETNMVGIDFGQISIESKEHKLSIELEYKDGSISPPLELGNLIKKELPSTEIIDQKH